MCMQRVQLSTIDFSIYFANRQSAQQALWSDSSGPVNFASALPGSAQVQSFVSVETVPWSMHSMPRAISQSSLSSILLPPGIGLRRVPSVLLNSR